MSALIRRRPCAVFFATLIAGACSSAPGRAPETPAPAATDGAARPADRLSAAELEAIYRARADSARRHYTAADVAFMSGMIHHHAQAIVMARLVPANTDNASIGVLAARIINAQRDEIARMQQWLRDRGQPVPELHLTDDHVMVTGGATHEMHMPGMLTEEQLERLAAARGAEFDRLFLEYMIQHHAGAVTMVHELFATDGAAQGDEVFKLASDVQVDQATEIARMEQMLSAMRARDGGL